MVKVIIDLILSRNLRAVSDYQATDKLSRQLCLASVTHQSETKLHTSMAHRKVH